MCPHDWSGRPLEESFLGSFCTNWYVSVGLSPRSAYQKSGIGVLGANGTTIRNLHLVRMTPCPPRLNHQTSWMGDILTGRDECLAKVVWIMKLGLLEITIPVRITPCPPRLHHQISGTGSILTGDMTFCRDEFLAKVVCTMELGVLDIKIPVRMPPVLLHPTARLCGQWASLQGRWHDFLVTTDN